MGMQSVFWHGVQGVCSKLCGGLEGWGNWVEVKLLVGTFPLTFTFRTFRLKVDSKVMGHL